MVELKAGLKELDLPVGGNKQELYERLLAASEEELGDEHEEDGEIWDDEEDWEDGSGIDLAGIGLATVRTVVRLRAPIISVLVAGLLVTAAAAALPKLFQKDAVEKPEVHLWNFTVSDFNQTSEQYYFVDDDTTERVTMAISFPRNISSVYIGAYFKESDEEPGGIVGCDIVTVELSLAEVNKTNLYSLSNTEATSQDCDADGTTPWDQIWYRYDLDLPDNSNFEGTREEALALWDTFTGIGTGEWFIDISVDTYTFMVPPVGSEDGEDVRLTIQYTVFEIEMQIIPPEEE